MTILGDLFTYGPERTYVGRYVDGERRVEVWQNGEPVRQLHAIGTLYGYELTWDYTGSGSSGTAAAILTDALGEPVEDEGYTRRVCDMALSFCSEFFGDARHGDVHAGFVLPGEVVLLWVMVNELKLQQKRAAAATTGIRARSMADIAVEAEREVREPLLPPAPSTIDALLEQGRRSKLAST